MTQTATNSSTDLRPAARTSRVRPWIALAAAGVVFAVGLFGILPFIVALPVIGVVLAFGAPPDHVAHARPIAQRPRNAVLGEALAAALAVVILQPQLSVPLVTLFGLDGSGLAVTCLAVVALALPLAMADAKTDKPPTGWFLLTRRNLILSLTILVVVATWYGERGLSLLPIGGSGAQPAADHRVQPYRRRPTPTARIRPAAPTAPRRTRTAAAATGQRGAALRAAGPHRVRGAYNPVALQLTPGLHRILLVGFVLGLVAFVLLSLVPLRQVRAGSNLLVAAGTIFLAVQLISVYRPPVDAVTVGSPLAGEWWVGHGGHAELVNYHQTRSTQRDALDIMQVVDGSIHRPGSTELTSYYIYDQPVLAPADGTVTYLVDGHPDLPDRIGRQPAPHRKPAGDRHRRRPIPVDGPPSPTQHHRQRR